MSPFLNQSRTKVSPLDEDQGLAPEHHQRASKLSGHMANPTRVWMRATGSPVENEAGFRPFQDELGFVPA